MISKAKEQEQEQKDKENAELLFEYIKELSILKYKTEERREDQLIRQACQMQAVFSFMAVMASVIVTIIENYIKLPLCFYFFSLSFFMLFLFLSLLFASISLWRWKINTFPDIGDMREQVLKEKKVMMEKLYQLDQFISLLKGVHEQKVNLNNRRVTLITLSMIFFYASIGVLVVSFLLGIIIYNC